MKSDEILMIGDSLIEYGDWETLLGKAVINRGMGGDTTEGVLMRIGRSLERRPDKIFLMVGVNDIITGETTAFTARNYEAILQKIRALSPDSAVYVHKALPCNPEKLFFVFDNRRVTALNWEIERLAEKYSAECIDLWDVLTENGELLPAYTLDGVHLTAPAYALWAQKLRRLL
ncbi:GDSL-type esterase/lipase family protein [Eubacterium sp. 1001713B170207_170306_E7]|uniref:GDSL-type esterase/lipase family protein n=1 Tax=Eubacterium sp. 1001713B170207_170306_E7 TaxID=2787097 RepID=UPI001899060B|nr:GDSL-type esterase/lipase family protein [Eubacterium sp. 1001713B170207_170306_E7]